MTTGARIKAARKAAGMTQAELAAKLGISFQSVAQWENDLRNPKYETLQKIALALGMSVSQLLSDDQQKIYKSGFDLGVTGTENLTDFSLMSDGYSLSEVEKRLVQVFSSLDATGQQKAVERVTALAKEAAANTPDDAASDVETNDLTIFDRVCQLTGYYTRPKLDDLSGYYLGKLGEESEEVFLSNKEFRALIKRVAAATAAIIDSEMEVAKDGEPPK